MGLTWKSSQNVIIFHHNVNAGRLSYDVLTENSYAWLPRTKHETSAGSSALLLNKIYVVLSIRPSKFHSREALQFKWTVEKFWHGSCANIQNMQNFMGTLLWRINSLLSLSFSYLLQHHRYIVPRVRKQPMYDGN